MTPRKRKVLRGVFIVLGVLLVLWGYFYWFSRKPIRKEIVANYPVADAAFQRSINGLLGTPFVGGNKVDTLINGKDIFPSMLEAIRAARTSITLETYIWSEGKICDEFKEAVSKKAKEGVLIHVIVDGMGSIKLRQQDIKEMQDAGVQIVKFNRDQWYKVNLQINHRTHRKILVVDGRIGFIGGACLHDSWLGDAETDQQWRDTHFRIEGPAVAQLQGIFADNWRQTTGEVLHGPKYFPELETVGDFPVQSYMCGPKENQENIRLAFLLAIAAAQKNLRIAHAYFLPDELTIKTILAARKRGVEIEVIVPSKLDSKLVKAASRSKWGELMEAGVKFYEYGPAMYHVKEMIVDDMLVIAGSANFDNRSFRINDEANFNVLDKDFAAEQIAIFDKDKQQSKALTLAQLKKRSIFTKTGDTIASVFGSQF